MARETGDRLGPFEIVAMISVGGMGEVYRAKDVRLGRIVALKVMRPDVSSRADLVERFFDEARAVAGLQHADIATLFEFDEHEGEFYMAFEFVEGGTLKDRIAPGPLPVDEAARIGERLARALAHAHERGVIHRDLKPGNVLMTGDGAPKLTDFGLAKITREWLTDETRAAEEMTKAAGELTETRTAPRRLTKSGTVMGTAPYMSPEQALGRDPGPATDVFSLGTLLYEMTTGRLPFTGATGAEVRNAICNAAPVPPRQARPEIPPALDAAIRRALQKEPAKRFESMAAFAGALARVADPGASARSPATSVPPLPEPEFPLVARDAALGALAGLLDAAVGGSGRTALVVGEAGSGKTRLLHELGREGAKRGARYAIGRCLFREGVRPYRAVVDALRRLLDTEGIASGDDLRDYAARHAPHLVLSRLGVLENLLALSGAEETEPANPEELHELFETLLFALTATGPLIVHLDDLHWADEATLRLFAHLALGVESSRFLLVGTYRPEEVATDPGGGASFLHEVIERVTHLPTVSTIRLGRMSWEETAELVATRYPERAFESGFARRLQQLSSGNPLFAVETLKLLEAEAGFTQPGDAPVAASVLDAVDVPDRLRPLIERRLDAVSPERREALEIAAVEGETFHSDTVATCLGLAKIPLLRTLQALQREHKLIHADGRRYRFDHAMIRDVLYEQITPELRLELHRLVGHHLLDTRGGNEDLAGSIAYHLAEAEEIAAALPLWITAGERARRLFATGDARRFFETAEATLARLRDRDAGRGAANGALADLERRIEWGLGQTDALTGRAGDARERFERYGELARAAGDDVGEIRALERRAHASFRLQRHEEAARLASRARELAEEKGLPGLVAAATMTLSDVHYAEGKLDDAVRELEATLALQEEQKDDRAVLACLSRISNVHQMRGDYDRAAACLDRAAGLARSLGDRRAEGYVLNGLGGIAWAAGQQREAVEHFDAALRVREEMLDRSGASKTLNNLGLAYEALGEYDAALAHHDRSLALKRSMHDENGVATSLVNVSSVEEHLGNYEKALANIEEALEIKERIGRRLDIPECRAARARLLWKLGATERAREEADAALDASREIGQRSGEVLALAVLYELDVEEGEAARAEVTLGEALALARAAHLSTQEMLLLASALKHRLRSGSGQATEEDLSRLEHLAREIETEESGTRMGHVRALLAARSPGSRDAHERDTAPRDAESRDTAPGDSGAGRGDDAERGGDAIAMLRDVVEAARRIGLARVELEALCDLARLGSAGAAADRDAARGLLMKVAGRIEDASLRASFLARPMHREILDAKPDS